MRGQKSRTFTMRDPDTKTRHRVRLPKELLGQKGHARISRVTLEVLP
ncbi:hypothetical protein DEIPH_ctg041orf0011 [Deinococcus phoenicis]|uniref:Uncharacterized protein n=2 Tax=Deinococcus phoenicis TaxID=1476583 RepID=A0A016QMP2_9DEIO|nr:hypothetical protein DEIPH_ctg041orf0011 [Deinococcus phoenicis]